MLTTTQRKRVHAVVGSVVIAILAFASSVFTATRAHAEYWDGGMSTASWTSSNYSYNQQWQPGMDQAVSNWNFTDTPVNIRKSSLAKGTIVAKQFNHSWYGLYTAYGPRNSSRTFTINLNSRTISAAQRSKGGTMKNWVTAIFVHELGQGLSLKDNPKTPQLSIMKYRNNWSFITKPTAYDIKDVNSFY